MITDPNWTPPGPIAINFIINFIYMITIIVIITDQGSRAEDSCKLNEESNDSGDNDQVATICEFINNTMRLY